LIEACEAFIECGRTDLAEHYARRAIQESSQIKSFRTLRDWINIFHKTVRLSRDLNAPDLPHKIFLEFNVQFFFAYLLAFENQPLLTSYTYHLFRTMTVSGFDKYQSEIVQWKSEIINAARNERRIVLKSLSLILADASVDDIREAANGEGWYQPWERSLAFLIFSSKYPAVDNPFINPPPGVRGEWQDIIRGELNEHTSNLEFALTLHLAAVSGLPDSEISRAQQIANIRREDEILGMNRWLLGQPPGSVNLDRSHVYIWTLLKRTVLRATYLSWENDLIEAADSAALKQKHLRDLEAILS
jgi:hypothetical protein